MSRNPTLAVFLLIIAVLLAVGTMVALRLQVATSAATMVPISTTTAIPTRIPLPSATPIPKVGGTVTVSGRIVTVVSDGTLFGGNELGCLPRCHIVANVFMPLNLEEPLPLFPPDYTDESEVTVVGTIVGLVPSQYDLPPFIRLKAETISLNAPVATKINTPNNATPTQVTSPSASPTPIRKLGETITLSGRLSRKHFDGAPFGLFDRVIGRFQIFLRDGQRSSAVLLDILPPNPPGYTPGSQVIIVGRVVGLYSLGISGNSAFPIVRVKTISPPESTATNTATPTKTSTPTPSVTPIPKVGDIVTLSGRLSHTIVDDPENVFNLPPQYSTVDDGHGNRANLIAPLPPFPSGYTGGSEVIIVGRVVSIVPSGRSGKPPLLTVKVESISLKDSVSTKTTTPKDSDQ